MQVPSYWAEARRQRREGGRQVTVRRFGWSEVSQAAAEAAAAERADAALDTAWLDASHPRRELKVPYNGAAGVPIREEVLERHGAVVLTRNSYGAVCLNAPDLLIADIDGEDRGRANLVSCGAALLAWPAVLLAGYLMGLRNWFWVLFIGLSGMGLYVLRALLASRLANPKRRLLRSRKRLQEFIKAHPEWRVRLYTTPKGLRIIAVHGAYDPLAQIVREFFRILGVDPVYARMCARQRCFRARLTAKPWRIGLTKHLKPRPGVWPVAPEHMPARRAWLTEYEQRAAAFAACRFEAEYGLGRAEPGLSAQVALHDARSRALSNLPLA
jgi:hypothetical protein